MVYWSENEMAVHEYSFVLPVSLQLQIDVSRHQWESPIFDMSSKLLSWLQEVVIENVTKCTNSEGTLTDSWRDKPTCTHIDLVQPLEAWDIPDHVHHKDDVEDNEEVVRVPEDLIVGHPEEIDTKFVLKERP